MTDGILWLSLVLIAVVIFTAYKGTLHDMLFVKGYYGQLP